MSGLRETGLRSAMRDYIGRVRDFRPNARLYLTNVVVTGAAMGVFYLLFNFYVLSLGYDQVLVGKLVTLNSLTALLAALPSGYLADQFGRKASLLAAGTLSSLALIGMVLYSSEVSLYVANVLFGLGQSLAAVTMGPFLMENSGESERTYLFSLGQGLQMTSASLGNWLGGYLPAWMGSLRAVPATHSQAYSGALVIVALMMAVGLVPLLFLSSPRLERSERSVFAPIQYAIQQPAHLGKLILPMMLTSIGAGLIMPFMNVFFRQVHSQPDTVIGTMFAWGSLAMGLGLLVAPPLADRLGKIQVVVITQGLSIPFLVLLGFAPWFWLSAAAYYVRLTLMNMSTPVYQTFVMEQVETQARATVASLVSMAWNFGWAFSPVVSGWLQVQYGFAPAFIGTIGLYSVAIFLYWAFFWRGKGDTFSHPLTVD